MNITVIKDFYEDYKSDLPIYEKAYNYYKGNTDAMRNYKMVTERSNNRINTNFIKKFVKEEVSYSVGNEINYLSNTGNSNYIDDIIITREPIKFEDGDYINDFI